MNQGMKSFRLNIVYFETQCGHFFGFFLQNCDWIVFLNDTVRFWVVCNSSFVFILSIIRVGSLCVVFVCLYRFCVGLVLVCFVSEEGNV